MEKLITVFTPTYNRKSLIPHLYKSLCEQDCQDFVWLVVDDGSSDGTEELLRSWMAEGKVDIRYYYQQNAGKMQAHNRGVELCETEYFVCIDSDDYLSSPTVIRDTLAFLADNKDVLSRDDVSGVVSYRKMLSGPQGQFLEGVKLATLTELANAGFNGETTLMFKTSVIRRFRFPLVEGEKFMTEDFIYDQMDEQYKMLVFPYYSQDCEYQADGFTRNGWEVLFKNPKSYRIYYNQCIRLGRGDKSRNMRMYIACSLIANDGKMFSSSDFKGYLLLMLPLGFYQYHRLKQRKW